MLHVVKNKLKTIHPLIWRVGVFLCLFLLLSGIVGPQIISGGILFRDGFALYGGVGKAVIFGLIAFILLARHNKAELSLRPWHPSLLGWMAAAGVLFIIARASIDNLLVGERSIQNLLGAHVGLLLCLVFVIMGCFAVKNLRLLWQTYRREIITSLVITILFYIFLLVVYALWHPLASVVMVSVQGLLGASGLEATVIPPHTLIFDKFGITIAEYCSGIESIALFTSLYAVVGLLDWKRLNRRHYFIVFPFALVLLFMLNIVRVYALILAGYHINAEIAFSLFHTYAGMIFFILYSAVFWTIAYRHLVNQPTVKPRRSKT